jgi:hypothetical protein
LNSSTSRCDILRDRLQFEAVARQLGVWDEDEVAGHVAAIAVVAMRIAAVVNASVLITPPPFAAGAGLMFKQRSASSA